MIKFKAFLLILSTVFILNNGNGNIQNIEGRWELCARGNDEQAILDNICHTVFFDKNGTGCIKLGSEERGNFLWKIKGRTIEIAFQSEKNKALLFCNNCTYTFEIYNEGQFQHFKLEDKNTNWWYRLSRTIK